MNILQMSKLASAILLTAQLSLWAGGQTEQAAMRLNNNEVDQAVIFSFDDHAAPFTGNLQLSMELAKKHANNPVMPIGDNGTPDEWQIRFYGTIIEEEGTYRMWYIAAARDGFSNPLQGGGLEARGFRFAYAESKDGVEWIKPNLGLEEFRGNKNNNLLNMPDGFRGYHALVLHEPEEPDPSRRYKMMALLMERRVYQWDVNPSKGQLFVPLYSADGLNWRIADELVTDNPAQLSLDYNLLDAVEGSGLYKWKGMYYLSGQSTSAPADLSAMAPYGRHVQMWRSADLLNWSETQTMGFAREGQFEKRANRDLAISMDREQTHEGVSVWNRGNVLLGVTGFWHGNEDWTKVTHPLALLISNDGLHFREPQPEFEFAPVGEKGRDWDNGGLGQGQAFENVGDFTYMWYGAPMDQGTGPRTGLPLVQAGGVGLLIFDRDRFGSVSPFDPNKDGVLITTEIELRHDVTLAINAEGVAPLSLLRVELLDALERPIPGYSGKDAATVTVSGLNVPVKWPSQSNISASLKKVKVRVRLEGEERNAIQLYALYLNKAD